ncbi:TfoX/Sxy family protein [Microlunatus antarcticus]|uniref:TfoX/Sxy family transcriptional regulator of competence genes n=1 Tax=Microlunatus antarcticus TaxID=53388 RepID=A0A7W5JT73_9ACTN|nr:TfoX/Sxy family transcriptional regulator of competence genes [Microlunatus antarcticus]
MPYDVALADRIRMVLAEELLGGELDDDEGDLGLVEEKKMFGGLGFMVAGHLAVCAGSKGDLMVRVDPAEIDALCADADVEPMAMAGRTSKSWVNVAPEALTDDALSAWIERGVTAARSASRR